MHPRLARAMAAVLLLSLPALGAEVTSLTGDLDEEGISFELGASISRVRRTTSIRREVPTAAGIILADELYHVQTTDEVALRLGFGLWRGFEVHILSPLVLRDLQEWRYATVNGQSVEPTSTLKNNHISISGCAAPGSCDPAGPISPILPVPGSSQRQGLRDPTIGIAWGIVEQMREVRLRPDLFPPGKAVSTWLVGVDYTVPVPGLPVDDPSLWGPASATDGSVLRPTITRTARKAHVVTAWTAFSTRYRSVEPYVRLSGTAPFAVKSKGPGSGAYDNCWHPERLADVAVANCAGPWAGQTGYRPPYEAALTMGTEFVVSENPAQRRRFAFDLRGDLLYHGPARDYTQVTDALGKLTAADEYFTFLAHAGFSARVTSFLRLRIDGVLGFDSAHLLTHEDIGEDKNGDGVVALSAGTGQPAPDQNPNYDFRIDQPGRRIQAEMAPIWGVSGSLVLNF